MVRHYWQYTMRAEARAAAEMTLHPFTKRPVANLTTEMAMEHFGGMQAVQLESSDGIRTRLRRQVSSVGLQILRHLRIPETVYWTPPLERSEICTI